MRVVVEYFLSKNLLLNLMSVLIIVVGAYKALTMNREAFPNVNFDIVSISTVYPGASAAEVEKLITKPIEDNIKSVDGIKEFRSSSIENRSGIVITIDPNVPDSQKVIDDIKSAVDRVEDLPEDAKDPLVQEITTARTPVIEINLGVRQGPDGKDLLTEKELKFKAKILEDQLLDIPEVGRVVRRGYRNTEMLVNIDPISLDKFSVSSMQVINALKSKNINFPGGNITDQNKESIIRTVGEFDTPREIANVFIRSNDAGRFIQLKEVASVEEGFEDKEFIEKVNGLQAITLVVVKKERGDAIHLVDKVREIINKFEEKEKNTLTFSFVNDMSKYIRRRLQVLISNGIQGFVLVVISLFFFLGWRVSLMVAFGLPLAMSLTFIILDYLGMTLNLISMMGLIIVVGMLVDDAIVISENIFRYIEEGMDLHEACVRGTTEVIAPVTATITTTVAAFAPMLFVTGIFGKFIYSIPLVVIVALCSSLFEAFFILPSHLYDINKGGVKKGEIKEESHWFAKVRRRFYKPSLGWALKHEYLTLLLLIVAFILSMFAVRVFGKFKLFPGGVEIFICKITAETGLTLEETERFIKAVEREVAKLPKEELENYVSRVGITQKDVNDPFTKRGKHYGQVMVYLTPDSDRKRTTEDVINDLRNRTEWLLNEKALSAMKEKEKRLNESKSDDSAFIKWLSSFKDKKNNSIQTQYDIPYELQDLKGKLATLDYEKLSGGPPVGKPVAIEVKGDDYETLRKIVDEYKKLMATVTGVIDISDDYNEGKDEIRVTIDEGIASQVGVSVQQIAIAINAAYQGNVATTIKRADEEIDVRVRFPENYRNSVNSLNKIHVMNNAGNLIPISNMIKINRTPGIASINHFDGKRLLTATANLDENKTTPIKANTDIDKVSKGLIEKYPGYRVRFGGEYVDTDESMKSLGKAFIVAAFIIFVILVSLFHSFIQPFIVMAAIPFSFIGVVIAFLTHGHYFSFLSFIGIVGLAGVVVNDSIVLVDFANQLHREKPGLSSYELLLEAGCVRLRPVILTTITTVLGILPTAYGIGGSDPFLMPMALAIGWGLAFSTLLTLIIVPVLYKLSMDIKIKLNITL